MIGRSEQGFSLVELLVAATVFTFIAAGVSGLFVSALNLQRRAASIQRVEENAQFVMESIAREVRVSTITSGDTNCSPIDPIGTRTLGIMHPMNGAVTYEYSTVSGNGVISRNGEPITTDDVDVTSFAFCVSGTGPGTAASRVTMPMTIRSATEQVQTSAETSLQSSVVSRDLSP